MTSTYRIYWTDADQVPHAKDCSDLKAALALTEDQRNAGMHFVTMVSENSQNVGKSGVATVADGKLPNGEDYQWSKAGRAGKVRRGDKVIATKDAH